MSTRSIIGVLNQDGTIDAIYCHFDGYVEYVGKVLDKHYSDNNKASQLVELGALSSLNERIEPSDGEEHSFEHPADGVTVAYHRDRGEKLKKMKFASEQDMIGEGAESCWAEFCYIWKNGAWYVAEAGSRVGFDTVANVLERIAEGDN